MVLAKSATRGRRRIVTVAPEFHFGSPSTRFISEILIEKRLCFCPYKRRFPDGIFADVAVGCDSYCETDEPT
jgi:hypothetical protein